MNKRLTRVLLYLLLNIIISAITMWVVLNIWGRTVLVNQPAILPGGVSVGDAGQSDPAPAVTEIGMALTSVIGVGDLENERMQLRYSGVVEISLAGWELHDEGGNIFVFPGLTMHSGGAVDVYTGSGNNTVNELYWRLGAPVWEAGETATLYDPDGHIQATYSIP